MYKRQQETKFLTQKDGRDSTRYRNDDVRNELSTASINERMKEIEDSGKKILIESTAVKFPLRALTRVT